MKQLLFAIIVSGCAFRALAMENNALNVFHLMLSVEKKNLLDKNRETQKNAHAYTRIPMLETANPLANTTQLAGNNQRLSNNSGNACTRFLDLFCCGQCDD